jgi:hypothetical protein
VAQSGAKRSSTLKKAHRSSHCDNYKSAGNVHSQHRAGKAEGSGRIPAHQYHRNRWDTAGKALWISRGKVVGPGWLPMLAGIARGGTQHGSHTPLGSPCGGGRDPASDPPPLGSPWEEAGGTQQATHRRWGRPGKRREGPSKRPTPLGRFGIGHSRHRDIHSHAAQINAATSDSVPAATLYTHDPHNVTHSNHPVRKSKCRDATGDAAPPGRRTRARRWPRARPRKK